MTAPLLVLRVGYMARYDGPDTIMGGGSFVTKNGVGGEVFNFKPSRGVCYGYVSTRGEAGVNLNQVKPSKSWQPGDELGGVDVVFIARRPGFGQVVVGWYRNATVLHRQYRMRRGVIPGMQATSRSFMCTAKSEDVVLLPEDDRTFEVPANRSGFPGTSNVWYPSHNTDKAGVSAFIRKLTKYIDATPGTEMLDDEVPARKGGGKRGRASAPDHAHNAMVEKAAVNAVWAQYEADGYALKTVETECLGWDLEATKGRQFFRLEVKGTAGTDIHFELTPNEYAKMKEHSDCYRVCVVCDALNSPLLFELLPNKGSNGWELRSADREVYVPLMERTAAVGAEVRQEKKA